MWAYEVESGYSRRIVIATSPERAARKFAHAIRREMKKDGDRPTKNETEPNRLVLLNGNPVIQ